MDKPITIHRQEFMETIVNAINEATLPAFVMRGVLQEADKALQDLEQKQYQNDLTSYEQNNALENEKIEGEIVSS